ncbi:MAG: hypothetical protein GQ574_14425 [Crocinitomix sp.]|nr:hypothetical protein [Crocinitomix sp.]
MLKKIIVLAAIIAAIFQSKGQDIHIDSVYQHNFFSLTLRCGLNKTQFIPSSGPIIFNSQMGIVPSLNFDYQWNVHPSVGISMSAGFGFFPFRFTLENNDPFNNPTGQFRPRLDQNFQIYARVLPGVNYHKSISENLMYNATLKGGVASVAGSTSTWGFGDSTELTYNYIDNIRGVLSLETGVTYCLSNKDLLGVNLSYEHFLQPIARGGYSQPPTNAFGTILNNGNNFGLSVTYTFTQLNNKYRINEIKERGKLSEKASKKEFKKEKRFIAPYSTFIGAGTTTFGLRSAVTDPSNYFISNWGLSGGFYVETERGMGKDYFLEMRGEALQFNQNISTADMGNNFGYSLFWVGRVSFGGGKRFILKASNRNIFNLHAGFSLNYTTREVGENIGFAIQSAPSSTNYFEVNTTELQRKQIYPTLYTTIEKDFRLAKMLYFSVKYRFDLGFMDVHELQLEYKTDENAPEFNQATSLTNGTTHGASFGFKLKL